MKILGIGNAIVDVICKVEDTFIGAKTDNEGNFILEIDSVYLGSKVKVIGSYVGLKNDTLDLVLEPFNNVELKLDQYVVLGGLNIIEADELASGGVQIGSLKDSKAKTKSTMNIDWEDLYNRGWEMLKEDELSW